MLLFRPGIVFRLESGDGIEFDLVGCDDAKALALLGVIAECAS